MEKKLKILIADDDPIICLDLKEMLEEFGYEVLGQAKDGLELIEKAKKLLPQLIVTDIEMPNMDGLSAVKVLNNSPELKNIPVVMLTAHSQPDMIEKAVNLGVFAYLVKPFTQADISPTIQIALNRWKEFNAIQKEVGKLQKDIDSLKESLEVRKLVEQAKGILIAQHNMTESEAFKSIQKLSMNSRKSMKSIAEAIILADQINNKN